MSRIRIRNGGANGAREDDVRPPRRSDGGIAFGVRGRGKVEDGASFLFIVVCVFPPYLSSCFRRRMRMFVDDVFRCCVVLKEKILI